MGKCVYVALRLDGIEVREIPSEKWIDPAEAGRALAVGQMLNTTVGVWFYEHDLWDREALRAELMALVEHVTAPDFLPEYQNLARKR